MYKRLAEFYTISSSNQKYEFGSIWDYVITFHKTLEDALRKGNTEEIAKALNGMAPSGGLSGIEATYSYSKTDPLFQELAHRLARRIGILNIPNPEQQSPTQNWKITNIEETLRAIEDSIGCPMSVPPCFGFDADASKIPHRFFFYCSAAFTIQCQVEKIVDVLEIGAGLGNLGFISHHKKARSYTVIDIPSVAVMSAFFVSKTVGESNVWLFGEPENNQCFAKFYPQTHYEGVFGTKYNVIFNSDSLPEIPISVQDLYLDVIANCLSKDGIFLSINHESNRADQSSVLDAVKRNGKLKLSARYPFMMRDGYIEEIYKL